MPAISPSPCTSAVARRICAAGGRSQLLATSAGINPGRSSPRVSGARIGEPRPCGWLSTREKMGLPAMQTRGLSGRESRSRFSTSARAASNSESRSPASSPHSAGPSPAGQAASLRETLQPPGHLNAAETHIFVKLARGLRPERLVVKDVSGGCGSMYAIEVCSESFRGLGILKQQRLVNEVLGREMVQGWHGVQVMTSVPAG